MNCSLCPLSVAGGFLMAHTVPLSHLLQGAVSSSLTCLQTAEGVAALLMERGGVQEGDHVALVYPPGIDLIAALYGCLYAGCVPITVRPPHPQNISTTLPTVKMIVEVSHSACVMMTTAVICKLLRSKEAMATMDIRNWPPVLDTVPSVSCSLEHSWLSAMVEVANVWRQIAVLGSCFPPLTLHQSRKHGNNPDGKQKQHPGSGIKIKQPNSSSGSMLTFGGL
ncbi:disco-interacting protein 2 homolog C-like [Oreochromis aureus]|uniref:disco-interacting protein 2 homolog C-like n=1 Tax=Oreochromis aureus TaxID=47969 RepID=UPI001954CE5A|nr:disco-interacting protein 2 homolog C-like [Oreochromis aureus]